MDRSLAGYGPQGHKESDTQKKESDTTERLSMNSQEKGGRRQGEGEELETWPQLRSFSLIPQGAEEHKLHHTLLKSRKLISVSHCHCSFCSKIRHLRHCRKYVNGI